MELKLDRAMLLTDEPSSGITQEQGVELDYVLPDYFPDVHKLVKCTVTPSVLSQAVDGNRLNYELRTEIRILYYSAGSHILQCVVQNLHFSRTAELPSAGCSAALLPVTDYANCRAVSSRRLDVRGAVTIRITAASCRQREVVCNAFSDGIQLRKVPVEFPARQFSASRSLVLSEELELNSTQPPVLHIVRCQTKTMGKNQKFVSGKLLVQGELQVHLLYACEKDGDGALEPMEFSIPFSQLMEPEGLEEKDPCDTQVSVVSCDIKPVTDAAGEVRLLKCEAELRVECSGVHMESGELVTDAFSTRFPCEVSSENVFTGGCPRPVSESLSVPVKIACTDGEPDCVYDAWCDICNLSTRQEEGILVTGMLCCHVLIREKDGCPRMLEKEEPFEFRLPGAAGEERAQVRACVENCSYNLSQSAEISLKTEIRLEGTLRQYTPCCAVTDIRLGEEPLVPKNYALKLYFGRENESVWDIARSCCTSVSAVMEENDLTGDVLPEDGMLLIPMVR